MRLPGGVNNINGLQIITLGSFCSCGSKCCNKIQKAYLTFEACFHHATLVMAPALVVVLIVEMHFDAGDMLRQMAERAFHRRFGLLGQFFAT